MHHSSSKDNNKIEIVQVDTGKMAFGGEDIAFTSILGACIGLAIYDPIARYAGFACVMLPYALEDKENPGKYWVKRNVF